MDTLNNVNTLAQTNAVTSPTNIIIAIVVLIVGFAIGFILAPMIASKKLLALKAETTQLTKRAQEDAQNAAEKIQLEAERKALARKEEVDKELEAARADFRESERRLAKREDLVDRKDETLSQKEQTLADRSDRLETNKAKLQDQQAKLDQLLEKQEHELERVAQLDRTQAKEMLLERVADKARGEMGKVTRDIVEDAEDKAKDEAREILINAIQRYANEHSSEATVRTVAIPSDDMKGRIIGREGRNIRAFEKATGADIIVDDTPGVIVVSCFDKVRQAIAVEALERLIADGRMHPTRIEELTEKVRSEIGEKVIKAGKDAAMELKLKGLHPKIIEAMGKLTYR
ncbi:MAG: Rnase Y domain-containing protein, partial [Phycisphaerales bacterium]